MVLPNRVTHLKDKIAKDRQKIQALNDIGEQMRASEDGHVSKTDPDARSMATSGRGTGIVGYKAQTVVDAKHHLVVAHVRAADAGPHESRLRRGGALACDGTLRGRLGGAIGAAAQHIQRSRASLFDDPHRVDIGRASAACCARGV